MALLEMFRIGREPVMRRSSFVLLGLVVLSFALTVTGCKSGSNDGSNGDSTFASRDDLVATWSDGREDGETYEFRSDGTMIITYRGHPEDGTWSLSDGVLTMNFESTDAMGETTMLYGSRSASRVAIVAGALYFGVFHRTAGSGGSNLDGTWISTESSRSVENVSSPWENNTSTEEQYSEESLTVTEGDFEQVETEREVWDVDGEVREEESSEESRGTIREDGDRIFYTKTELDGEPIPDDEREELVLGIRIDPNVIVATDDEDESAESRAFRRQ